MIVIKNISSTNFTYQGVTHPKIYSVKKFNDKIKIFSSFDQDNEIMPYVKFSDIELDNVVYTNVSDLINNLMKVINR